MSKESKHTPGPWAVNPLMRDQICTADGRMEIARATRLSDPEITMDNAKLMKAAPSLLDFAIWVASLKTGGEIQFRAQRLVFEATGE